MTQHKERVHFPEGQASVQSMRQAPSQNRTWCQRYYTPHTYIIPGVRHTSAVVVSCRSLGAYFTHALFVLTWMFLYLPTSILM